MFRDLYDALNQTHSRRLVLRSFRVFFTKVGSLLCPFHAAEGATKDNNYLSFNLHEMK